MKVRVNLSKNVSYGYSVHGYAVPPNPAAFALVPAEEDIIPHAWRPGAGKHAFTKSVFHKHDTIVQEGHDAGWMIADRALGLPTCLNARAPFILKDACRKVAFAASTVLMNKKPVAAADDELPLMTCGEPAALPTAWPVDAGSNSVLVGVTAEDVEAGWLAIKLSIGTDVVMYALGIVLTAAGGTAPSHSVKDYAEAGGFDWKKSVTSALGSLTLSAHRSYKSGWKKPVSLKLEGGTFGITGGAELTIEPSTGDWKFTPAGNFGSESASTDLEGRVVAPDPKEPPLMFPGFTK